MVRVGILSLYLCLILNSFQTASLSAERKPVFEYDIFSVNDTLAVWLDITPVLTQSKMEDLISGLDIFVNVNIRLEQPRTLFFPRKLSEIDATFSISHPLTEDIYNLKLSNFGLYSYEFDNQLKLYDFLADSLIFKVESTASINKSTRVRLKLEISCKSFTTSILPLKSGRLEDEPIPADTSGTEFFLDIFTLFFDFIGYGEDEYKISSPIFKLEELPSLPR